MRAEGLVGHELTRHPFERAVWAASNAEVEHLVIVLDSPGGNTSDARRIADVLSKAPASLTVTVFVKRASGAAVWIVAAADNLLFSTNQVGAVLGSYGLNAETEPIPQATRPALLAEMVSVAERAGHTSPIFRALLHPPETEAMRLDRDDLQGLRARVTRPDRDAAPFFVTAAEAVALGLGRACGEAESDLFATLGVNPTAGRPVPEPETRFRTASREIVSKLATLGRQVEKVRSLRDELARRYAESIRLHDEARHAKPPSYATTWRNSGRYRPWYMERVSRYRRALHACERAMKQAASTEKALAKSITAANGSADRLNERLGYQRFRPVSGGLSPAERGRIDEAWRTIERELRWCESQ